MDTRRESIPGPANGAAKPSLLLLLLVCTLFTPASARGEPPTAPDWSLAFGTGAITVPWYPGSSSMRVLPVPFIDVRYKDLFFASPLGVGVNALAVGSLHMGVTVLPDLGTIHRPSGIGDVSPGAVPKLFASYTAGPLTLFADVGHELGASNGTLVDGGCTATLRVRRSLFLSATATLTWADARYQRAFFGIDARQSSAALQQGLVLPSYAAGAGLRDAGLALSAVVPLDARWSVQVVGSGELLLGSAAQSPLTERRFQPTVVAFMTFRP